MTWFNKIIAYSLRWKIVIVFTILVLALAGIGLAHSLLLDSNLTVKIESVRETQTTIVPTTSAPTLSPTTTPTSNKTINNTPATTNKNSSTSPTPYPTSYKSQPIYISPTPVKYYVLPTLAPLPTQTPTIPTTAPTSAPLNCSFVNDGIRSINQDFARRGITADSQLYKDALASYCSSVSPCPCP